MARNSRTKLNSLHATGAVGVAALLAATTGSWPLFVLIAASLLAVSFATGEVRGPRNGRRR